VNLSRPAAPSIEKLLAAPYLFLASLTLIVGVVDVVAGAAPTSVDAFLPEIGVRLWGAMLAIGSGMTLYGLIRNRWHAERYGLLLLCYPAFAYAVALLWYAWPQAVLSAGFTAGFGIACAARAHALRRVHYLGELLGFLGRTENRE
jgi:hypothetical protein